CKICKVALYCSENHRDMDEGSHRPSCERVHKAKRYLKDEQSDFRLTAGHNNDNDDDETDDDTDDDDFSYPAHLLAYDVNSYLNVPIYVEAACQHIEALIQVKTVGSLELAAEKAREMFRCFPSDPMDLRSDLPAVYLRLGRDQEAYNLVKWWQLNKLSDVEIHKSYPVVPYLDTEDADVFEWPSEIIGAIDGNSSLVNMFCVTLLKIKLLFDIKTLRGGRMLLLQLPPELVTMVEAYIPPFTDVVRNNHQILTMKDHTEPIADLTDQIKTCFEAVEKANVHLWPSLVNLELRPGGSRHSPSNDKRTVDFVMDRCYDSWVETPGAIDVIRVLLNFPDRALEVVGIGSGDLSDWLESLADVMVVAIDPKEDADCFHLGIAILQSLKLFPIPMPTTHVPPEDISHLPPIKTHQRPIPLLRALRPRLMVQKSRMHRAKTPFQVTLGIKPTHARFALDFLPNLNERRTAFWDRA
ncbi:MAG: hypothetical protein Q9204_007348, partial [Flavoplaca sp. TL-2023a]